MGKKARGRTSFLDSESEGNDAALKIMEKLLFKAKNASKRRTEKRKGTEGQAEKKCNKKSKPAKEKQLKDKPTKAKPKTKKWDTEETNRLIEILEEKTCLWDVNEKSYHIREKREKA